MLGAAIVLVANLLRQPSALPRRGAGLTPLAASGFVTALAQATLFEALDRAPVTAVAPLVGTGVLWTVVFAAMFLGRSEPVGRRLVVVGPPHSRGQRPRGRDALTPLLLCENMCVLHVIQA